MPVFYKPIITGSISLLICLIITPLFIKLAKYKGWVVYPRDDRWHKKPTALLGGIGIFTAYSISIFITDAVQVNWLLYIASATMFLTGLADDIWEIKPIIKLLMQVGCAFILIYDGFSFGGGLLGWAGIPLTFIWVIGITNAVNLLDNMDGLAACISGIIALSCGVLGILLGTYSVSLTAFAIAGACIGFLYYNFNPARIFMGDSGSLFLGFSLSVNTIAVQDRSGSSSAVLVLLIPICLMAIPIMDTTLVTIKRLAAGRRIDQGGKDHTSHRLVALGFNEKKAVLTLCGISGVWGLACIFFYKAQINDLFLCVLSLTIFSAIFSFLLSEVKVYNESEEKLSYLRMRGRKIDNNLMLRFFLFNKKLIIGSCTDILIIYGSFLIAAKTVNINVENDYVVLATFICIKIALFYISNFYNRILRYIELIEILHYFISIGISSLILILILFLKNKIPAYSLSFFMVDLLLTFVGITFSRLVYRWINDLISRNRLSEKKVIIYGAGDAGYLLIKELLQNHEHNLRPIGWLDDDESKHNVVMYGYKIYGGKEQLPSIVNKLKPDVILVSTKAIDHEIEEAIRLALSHHKVKVGRFNVALNY